MSSSPANQSTKNSTHVQIHDDTTQILSDENTHHQTSTSQNSNEIITTTASTYDQIIYY